MRSASMQELRENANEDNLKMTHKNQLWFSLLITIIGILPFFFHNTFYVDWFNHVWMTSYYSFHMSTTHEPPICMFANVIECGYPIFYGYYLYIVAGLLAMGIGPDAAIKLLISFFIFIVCLITLKVNMKWNNNTKISILSAISAAIPLYSLTNIYSRSALTEFFGYSCGMLSVMFFLWFIQEKKYLFFSLSAFFSIILIGIHPPSFYLFGLVLSPFLIGYFLKNRSLFLGKKSIILIEIAFFSTGILAYPIYLILKYSKALTPFKGELIFLPGIDSIINRIWPLATDSRLFEKPIITISTPYLDSPIQICLLPVIIGLIFFNDKNVLLKYKKIIRTLLFLAVFLAFASVGNLLITKNLINFLFRKIQFAYRLTSIINATLIATMIIAGINFSSKTTSIKKIINILIISGITLSLYWSVTKNINTIISQRDINRGLATGLVEITFDPKKYWEVLSSPQKIPSTFYGLGGYSLREIFSHKDFSIEENLLFSLDQKLGHESKILNITLAKDSFIQSNIIPTRFIEVKLNDKTIDKSQLYEKNDRIAFQVPKGENQIKISMKKSHLIPFKLTLSFALLWLLFLFSKIALNFRKTTAILVKTP